MRASEIIPIGILLGLVGLAAQSACTATIAFTPPAGYVTAVNGAWGTCDAVDTYIVLDTGIVATYCDITCPGSVYAICNGVAWGGCDCSIPAGYVLYSGPVGFYDPGTEDVSGTEDTGSGGTEDASGGDGGGDGSGGGDTGSSGNGDSGSSGQGGDSGSSGSSGASDSAGGSSGSSGSSTGGG